MRNAGLDEAQAGINTTGTNINNLRYKDDTTLTTETEEELKSLLMRVKEESEKAILNILRLILCLLLRLLLFSPSLRAVFSPCL